MPDFDLLIRGSNGDIGIVAEKFAAIRKNLAGSAAEEIDATRLSIFPGVIDSHVHFNEPGRADWEGWATGSRACAAGGTTTVFEMPLNAHPPTIDGSSFDEKRAAAEANSLIDFGLWGGLIPGNATELKTLHDRGVVGVKAFMCNSGIDDFPHADLVTLREGMAIAADLDLLVAVHAESQEMTRRFTDAKREAGETSIRAFLDSRPIAAELEAIRTAIDLAQETKCRLHIVHVSCGAGVRIVAEARANGIDVTCETCPHYLLLTEDDMERIGAMAKCAPPLRAREHQSELKEAIDDIETAGSDHSPCPPAMKEHADFFQTWGGISSCQHLLSLLLHADLSEDRVRALTGENVARRFRITQKGKIAMGMDADLTLVDRSATETVHRESLHYRHKHTPYMGQKLPRVVRTILRGQTIFQDGKLAARPIGKFIRPNR